MCFSHHSPSSEHLLPFWEGIKESQCAIRTSGVVERTKITLYFISPGTRHWRQPMCPRIPAGSYWRATFPPAPPTSAFPIPASTIPASFPIPASTFPQLKKNKTQKNIPQKNPKPNPDYKKCCLQLQDLYKIIPRSP